MDAREVRRFKQALLKRPLAVILRRRPGKSADKLGRVLHQTRQKVSLLVVRDSNQSLKLGSDLIPCGSRYGSTNLKIFSTRGASSRSQIRWDSRYVFRLPVWKLSAYFRRKLTWVSLAANFAAWVSSLQMFSNAEEWSPRISRITPFRPGVGKVRMRLASSSRWTEPTRTSESSACSPFESGYSRGE